jgi:hypothetical protein
VGNAQRREGYKAQISRTLVILERAAAAVAIVVGAPWGQVYNGNLFDSGFNPPADPNPMGINFLDQQ